MHSNKWYQSRMLKNLEYLRGHMESGEPVNISGWSRSLCLAGELDLGPCLTGKIVRFSPTSKIDGGGAPYITLPPSD